MTAAAEHRGPLHMCELTGRNTASRNDEVERALSVNPRTDGGLGQLRTDVRGTPPPSRGDLENEAS